MSNRLYGEIKPNYFIDIIPSQPQALRVFLASKPPLRWRLLTRLFFGWKVEEIK